LGRVPEEDGVRGVSTRGANVLRHRAGESVREPEMKRAVLPPNSDFA
jgi:hypothetical protein